MKTARYICIEGTEGVGKTTQAQKLYDYLREKGYAVLLTKEPGTSHSPLTMELRNVMLNAKYDAELTKTARELISQAIRSIHLEKVVRPGLAKYDFIIQDRGVLSGLSYGEACGNELEWLEELSDRVADEALTKFYDELYDDVVYLTGDVRRGLALAQSSKKEFEAGDAIEMKGISFMEKVNKNMREYSELFGAKSVSVDGKNIDQVFAEILDALDLGNK
jgi:dTMP kinase